jgi:hypothetical protein
VVSEDRPVQLSVASEGLLKHSKSRRPVQPVKVSVSSTPQLLQYRLCSEVHPDTFNEDSEPLWTTSKYVRLVNPDKSNEVRLLVSALKMVSAGSEVKPITDVIPWPSKLTAVTSGMCAAARNVG